MLIYGCLIMGFWLYLVGGLQARFGQWGSINNTREFNVNILNSLSCRPLFNQLPG